MGGFHLFTLANVPVSVSPWYFLLLVYFARGNIAQGMVLAACVTISLLAHEFGHALMARHFRLSPQVLLHGFGGVTAHERARTDRDEALIIAAGPLSGLLLGALVFAIQRYVPIESPRLLAVLGGLWEINLYWSIFNLLPMWPMDGGQLMRIGASKVLKPARGERVTHIVSIIVVALLAFASYQLNIGGGMLLMFLLAMTAFQNLQALSQNPANEAPRRANPYARELHATLERAYEAGDDDEAVRVAHQLRAESNVPPQIMAKVWTVLGVATTRKGDYEEALSYLKRAPDGPEVVEARAQCFYQLGMTEELEALVASKGFSRLPSDTRAEIMRALEERMQPNGAA